MKILITGNMGYIGPCVAQHLRQSYPQATLVGLDTGYFAHCLTNAHVLPECRVDIQYFSDIRRLPKEVLRDVDAIVHLAAISNDPMGSTFEVATFDINYRASIALAKEAKREGVKAFVFASSCSMYGLADDTPRKESSPLNPLTAYAKSKAYTERELQELADTNFKVTSLRFATACGMSERLRLDLVVNDFVACAVTSKNITILSDGTPWRPLIHIKDMARAFDWAIQRDASDGSNFLAVNIGSNVWNYQVKELAEAVAMVIPAATVSVNKDAQPDKRSYRVDFGLFEKLAPDHQPQVDLITSVRELKEGLEAMEFNNMNFRSSTYMRLEVLTLLRDKGLLDANLEWRDWQDARSAAESARLDTNHQHRKQSC
ncbi:MAG: SDR family oxidoreductase [Gammaproteobacteria bacterium]|nr:SDR family oxidoreductase [Gammaproteobacteria bacterium]